jgi:uncharacterized protein (TIGR00290 family)
MREPAIFCWSGGKDSALALNRVLREGRYDIVALLTTCNEHFQRVSMHGVRLELLRAQADALGLPLDTVFVSQRSSNEEYAERMGRRMQEHRARGVTTCLFGDIFLEDLRQWREANLARIGLKADFPIWKVDSRELVREFFAEGFGSVLCCVNDAWLDESFAGRKIDEALIRDLPAGVDPCGENGEYHSFAFAGPIFRAPIRYTLGEKVYRPIDATHPGAAAAALPAACPLPGERRTKGFWFCDLLPS